MYIDTNIWTTRLVRSKEKKRTENESEKPSNVIPCWRENTSVKHLYICLCVYTGRANAIEKHSNGLGCMTINPWPCCRRRNRNIVFIIDLSVGVLSKLWFVQKIELLDCTNHATFFIYSLISIFFFYIRIYFMVQYTRIMCLVLTRAVIAAKVIKSSRSLHV